ncbi:hypothetical protein QU661_00090 [Mogibacterium neglectum]|uniref:hypothetical protein n=1 Tax=Mogibacterium neglectum TaxID=114528 RepID=UPI00272A7DEB|nr:hypothetical protein [Mogibacterium neglectum]WLD76279.1 hypothetical protein QU661_00090 [Mogibacterium neglectum]
MKTLVILMATLLTAGLMPMRIWAGVTGNDTKFEIKTIQSRRLLHFIYIFLEA